ncbi:unnamed protein product [Symbiodinium natans]|uniref:Uncharacterized protein n=1 Tax=Symbiodinium natans TaxID=878477 RepID=A0A812V270_9DINO|nr:unnamed protein product [Symbiodinium natans]
MAAQADPDANVHAAAPLAVAIGQPEEASSEADRDQIETLFIDHISGMEVLDPSLVRATHAHRALRLLGRPLRGGLRTVPQGENLYRQSRVASHIQDFWSHSWHGNQKFKVLLLMLLYNGPAAAIAGTVASFLPLLVHGYLPAIEQTEKNGVGDVLRFSPWSTASGVFVFTLTLLFWPSQRSIFLDRMCINQVDVGLKLQGLVSMAGILKQATSLLVVWDETYMQRLWCVLELAAFWKSHAQPETCLSMWPVLIGPLFLALAISAVATLLLWILTPSLTLSVAAAVFLGRCLGFYIAGAMLREHYHALDQLSTQLETFSVSSTHCNCCSVGHVRQDGRQISICDREVVMRCMEKWFGTLSQFEHEVKTAIRPLIYQKLGSWLLPYRWLLITSTPLLWGFVDMAAARVWANDWRAAFDLALFGIAWWLSVYPAVIVWTLMAARRLRFKVKYAWLDRGASLLLSVLMTMATLALNLMHMTMRLALPPLVAGPSFLLITSVMAVITWRACATSELRPRMSA